MMTPISSPQNAIGLQYMDPTVSWIQWLGISIPMAVASNLICWLFLIFVYRPAEDTPVVQPIRSSQGKWQLEQVYVVVVSVVTIVLWCLSSTLESVFGHSGVIAIIPMILFFGTGILSKDDFNNFLWTVVILAMGGSSLGYCIENSGLLAEIATGIKLAIGTKGFWIVMMSFCTLILFAATFISHTVSAIIVLPIVKEVGMQIPGGNVNILVFGAVLMCSGAMGLPISGFPNITAVSLEDVTGRPYLKTKDFLLVGVPVSIIVCLLTVSLGYGFMILVGI
jgi:phosphate transporter